MLGRYRAVGGDVGDGLSTGHGDGIALGPVQLPAVVVERLAVRGERQTGLRALGVRHGDLPPAVARLDHLRVAGRVRARVHAPVRRDLLDRLRRLVPDGHRLGRLRDGAVGGLERHLVHIHGHDPALGLEQVAAVVVPRGTVRERQTGLRALGVRHGDLPPAVARLDHLRVAGRVRARVHAPVRRDLLRGPGRLEVHRHRLLPDGLDRDLDAGGLSAGGGLDGRGAGLVARGHHARAHHVRHARVRARPRDLPVRRVLRQDRGGQLRGRARLQAQLAIGHAITRNRHGGHRNRGLALDRGQSGGRAVPADGTASVVEARLAGTRELLAAAVVEDHLRVLGEVVRNNVLVTGLIAVVGYFHLLARPCGVVHRGRAVAGVHVGVHLAPTRRLGGVDGVRSNRRLLLDAGHRNGDRSGGLTGLRGDRGLAGLHRGNHTL